MKLSKELHQKSNQLDHQEMKRKNTIHQKKEDSFLPDKEFIKKALKEPSVYDDVVFIPTEKQTELEEEKHKLIWGDTFESDNIFKDMFLNPESYKIIPFDDKKEQSIEGYFVPSYVAGYDPANKDGDYGTITVQKREEGEDNKHIVTYKGRIVGDERYKERLKEMVTLTEKYYNIQDKIETILKRELRASGRTTRLADNYIQELFISGSITIRDIEDTPFLNKRLFDIILGRLGTEHRMVKLDKDREKLTISLAKRKKDR